MVTWTEERAVSFQERIEEVLDTIRPAIQADGGNVEFLDFDEGKRDRRGAPYRSL